MIGNMAKKLRNQVWDGINEVGPYHIANMEMKHNNNQMIISYTTGFFPPEAAKLEVERMIKRMAIGLNNNIYAQLSEDMVEK